MKRIRIKRTATCFPGIVYFSLVAALAGCGGFEVQSVWTPGEMKIDGVATDWPGTAWKEKDDIRFAVVNDSDYIYVAVVAVKPELRQQIAGRGLTLWFDPDGREKKSVGIRYPLGSGGRGETFGGNDQPTRGLSVAPELEYVSPLEPDRVRMPVLDSKGIEVKLNDGETSLVYELKIPLHASVAHPYSAESAVGAKISVGVEIGGFAQSRPAERQGDTGGAGNGEGGRGGRRGGGGGRGGRGEGGGSRGSGGRSPGKPVEIWASVQLASGAKP